MSMKEQIPHQEAFSEKGFRCNGNCSTCSFHSIQNQCESEQEITVGIYSVGCSPSISPNIFFKNSHFRFETLENISDILERNIDLVLYCADANNLEDNLFPASKIIDMPLKCLINLENYEDFLATEHAVRRDTLSSLLGIPVLAQNSHNDKGLVEILNAILSLCPKEDAAQCPKEDTTHARIDFGRDIEKALNEIGTSRYIALRLLEKEEYILPYLPSDKEAIQERSKKQIARLEKVLERPTEELVKQARRAFIKGALQETIIHSKDHSNHTRAQKIDSLLTNRWTGLPILALILFGAFEASFALGAYPQEWIERGVGELSQWLSSVLPPSGWSNMLTEGIIEGVGAVLSFLPNIVIMFFFLSLMEDSGYLSRAAFLLDKIMHRIGLHGKSFVPMLIGFGCNVPAIIAAKEIEDKRDRTLTMLMIPFMSCSARLPVYMLLVSAFFPRHKALVMIGLYLCGILLAIGFGLLMKKTRYFRKTQEDYVSELPEFSFPRPRILLAHIWERVADYLQKISTVIVIASVVIWALEFFPRERPENEPYSENSALALAGKTLHPILAPLGFDWKMSVCLITGLPAKEAIVSTMGILYDEADDGKNLEESLREERYESGPRKGEKVFTPASTLSFLVFVLLYFPCIATIQTLRRETSGKWAAFSVINSLALAYLAAFVVFRLFSLFG